MKDDPNQPGSFLIDVGETFDINGTPFRITPDLDLTQTLSDEELEKALPPDASPAPQEQK